MTANKKKLVLKTALIVFIQTFDSMAGFFHKQTPNRLNWPIYANPFYLCIYTFKVSYVKKKTVSVTVLFVP